MPVDFFHPKKCAHESRTIETSLRCQCHVQGIMPQHSRVGMSRAMAQFGEATRALDLGSSPQNNKSDSLSQATVFRHSGRGVHSFEEP
eukprot:3384139-Amphidinium_carterae.1